MEVRYRFTAMAAIIDNHSKTVFKFELLGHLGRHQHEVAEQRLVLFLAFRQTGYRGFGNDQKMNRGLFIDIMDDEAMLVFMFDIRRDLPVNDFAEYTLIAHSMKGKG